MEILDFDKFDDDAMEKYIELGRECKLITMLFHPYKMTIDEFAEEIKKNIDTLVKNLKQSNFEDINGDHLWIEDWMEVFMAYLPIEKGDFD